MPLTVGDPAPWFVARATNNPGFRFDNAAGRPLVLCFFGTAGHPASRAILAEFERYRDRFDDTRAAFFGVSIDADDERLRRVVQRLPGLRYFWDFDQAISRLYGAAPHDASTVPDSGPRAVRYRRMTLVLDRRLRVAGVRSFDEGPGDHVAGILRLVAGLEPPAEPRPAAIQAPVLVMPHVFEPEFCRELVALYERHGGEDSGYMVERAGRTVPVVNHHHKRRSDYLIADEGIREAAMARIHRRLVPELQKAFQFHATRMERYIVARYDAAVGGYFRPHRDNTTKGTSHRRFAVTINLNAEEYTGGDLRFPEFGPHTYRAPTGGAVVFSCSLLHEATPVLTGRRYVFLPFLYDEAAARVREQNNAFLGDEVAPYRAT